MSTSKEVTLALKEAAEIFYTIKKKPTDNNITTIVENLTPILMDIEYDPVKKKHNL